jgi:hypothetical protein
MKINYRLHIKQLLPKINYVFQISASKILDIENTWNPDKGAPVYTVEGKYSTKGWTEWTRGFQYGSALLQYDATADTKFLSLAKSAILKYMDVHLTHMGVHDHGFNNVSTYGNLLRLMNERKIVYDEWEHAYYELALKISGAVQAARWTDLEPGSGYIYSFNGPHSLFSDTIRTLRTLALSHQLGYVLMQESESVINLLHRLLIHAETTARYNVYFGQKRDKYDIAGRVAHESLFNLRNGSYRCPSTQQGYSPFSTWTRGLAWIVLGFAEEVEFIYSLPKKAFSDISVQNYKSKSSILERFLQVARITADFYISQTPSDGIPYWDTAAPGLEKIDAYLNRPADPYNEYEPVDSSAAAITAQGLLRLGHFLKLRGQHGEGKKYFQAGLTIADTLFDEPYLSKNGKHQGLILHSVYHRPKGWDYIPKGKKIPCGESSMWGDYHSRELALYLLRMANDEDYLTFFI